jgi:hypothetical protein
LLVLSTLALGCGDGGGTPLPRGRCARTADCPAGQACIDGTCRLDSRDGGADEGSTPSDFGPPRAVVSLAIVPAAPELVTVDGMPASIDLDVEATYDDGSTGRIGAAFWAVDSTRLGTIDAATGVFTATGALAGTVGVTVDAFGSSARTVLTVRVDRTVLVDGAPPDAPARFAAAPTATTDLEARRAHLLYPLEGAVMPQNVAPADVQWEGGNEGDLYRVRLETTGVRVAAYVAHTGSGFRYDWLVTREAWRALAEAAPETPVTVVVDRLHSGEVVPGTPRAFRFADAVIRGSIYYWDLSGGRIQRIAGDGSGRESFMPNPPPRPRDGRRCVACHTVSRDGTRMAAELWDGGDYGALFDLTADLSGDPAPTLVPGGVVRFLTASFSPDNRRLIANVGVELFLMDGDTGARLPAGGAGLPSSGAAHPTWSPDGAQIAFAANHDGPWGVDFRRSDLAVIDVTGPDTFGPPRVIHPGGGRVCARPTWSPSSQHIAFQYSAHSRIREDLGGRSEPRPGSVRMVSRDGATVWALELLNGGAENNYDPTFSPFDEGGYYWLAFVSTRDYGNAQAGTRGTGRRQIWVAAVRNAPAPGTDPSLVPYWLPQQSLTEENMAAYWAPEPCRAEGRRCATSAECCSGYCRDTGSGPVCVPPDVVECSEIGEACRTDADCCEGAGTCSANRCTTLG